MVLAAANGVGGDGAPLGGGEREPEKGGRRHGESARPGGVRGIADGVQGGRGGTEEMTRGVAVARRCRRAGWWRGELGRARRVPPLPTGARRKATGRRRWAGPRRWAAQCWAVGGLPGKLSKFSLSAFIYCFLFCSVLFWFSKILNHFIKS